MARWFLSVAVVIALLPVAALAIPNPLRALLPDMFGLACDSHRLCVDAIERREEAAALALPALAQVEKALGPFESRPAMIFCSSEECFAKFGRRRSTAVAFGGRAVLIGPRGWAGHFVRHELIHIAQYQRLGLITIWRAPKWLTEGMAYSLSEDPRRPLPGDLEALRVEFEQRLGGERNACLWGRVQALLKAQR